MKGPQRFFRNKYLCEGMVNFNMIDTVSRGIKKIFGEQLRRHFPMPELSDFAGCSKDDASIAGIYSRERSGAQ